ncbi:topoisomerase DNA-binding C4 zinc finger domain-containing protein [Candidatus Woesearchaeota archaeon]|nr:topoisomerase DNA-binding C4 zinc finger domain-containing protein [Candidatus Woesearchaeota archaeon]
MSVEIENAERKLTKDKCPKCGRNLYKTLSEKAAFIECSNPVCDYTEMIKY